MKNALKRLLVSALVLSITALSLATTAWAENPPGGLTSPTFNGIDVKGLSSAYNLLAIPTSEAGDLSSLFAFLEEVIGGLIEDPSGASDVGGIIVGNLIGARDGMYTGNKLCIPGDGALNCSDTPGNEEKILGTTGGILTWLDSIPGVTGGDSLWELGTGQTLPDGTVSQTLKNKTSVDVDGTPQPVTKAEVNVNDFDYGMKISNQNASPLGGGLRVTSADNTDVNTQNILGNYFKYVFSAGIKKTYDISDEIAGFADYVSTLPDGLVKTTLQGIISQISGSFEWFKPIFVVSGSGNVGINRFFPMAALDVQSPPLTDAQKFFINMLGGQSVTVARFIAGTGFLSNIGASVILGNTFQNQVRIRSGQGNLLQGKEGKLHFDLADADLNPLNGVWRTVMTMNGAGAVGINTANPKAPLEVRSPAKGIIIDGLKDLFDCNKPDQDCLLADAGSIVIAKFLASDGVLQDDGAAIIMGNSGTWGDDYHARIRSGRGNITSAWKGKLSFDLKDNDFNLLNGKWTNVMNLDGAGMVGIGIMPTVTLDVKSPQKTILQNIMDKDAGIKGLFSTTDKFLVVARFVANLSDPVTRLTNDMGAAILLGNEDITQARIRSGKDGVGGKLIFDLKDPSINPFDDNWSTSMSLVRENSAITTDTRVGINSSTPAAKLQVNNSAVDGGGTTPYANGLIFGQTGGWAQAGIWPVGKTGYNGDLAFGTQNSNTLSPKKTDGAVTGKMTLTAAGNLGIGTATPAYKLDVNGDANIGSGTTETRLYVDGDEAVWGNGTYFSWGYGGTYNYFADPIKIGGTANVAARGKLDINGDVYIGASPTDTTYNYLTIDRFSSSSTTTPPATDCDSDSEVGRIILVNYSNGVISSNRLVVCSKSGTSTATWKFANLQ